MTNRKKLVKAIIDLKKVKPNETELIEIAEMSHEDLVDKLISISYALKYPIKSCKIDCNKCK